VQTTSVNLLVEIPEELYQALQTHLERSPNWDQERLFTAAISLFLLQNGERDVNVSRLYLDSLFQ
jgi:hypothetical protein